MENEIKNLKNKDKYSLYKDDYYVEESRQNSIKQEIMYYPSEAQDRSMLGVKHDASSEKIREAYLLKVREAKGGGVELNTDIYSAYKRLSNIEKKRTEIREKENEKNKEKIKQVNEEREYDNEESIVFNCGSCGKQIRQNRDQGKISIICPYCHRVSRVIT
ncbi:MAG: hypothetical protein WCO84_02840 [bacterium]